MITHNLGIISELCQSVAVMYAGRIIEYGLVREVFRNPCHPYTIGLLGSIPKLSGERERLVAIPGRIADPQNLPAGCSFHPRCGLRTERCKDERPEPILIADNHFAECYNCGGEIA
jgi:peptide/nickel transport system ATP-binding protein